MLNVTISSLDHVVYNVADAEASVSFYSGKLGLETVRLDEFRRGEVPFPSVRISAGTIVDFFPPSYHRSAPGGNNVNHIALAVRNSAEEIDAFLADRNIPVARVMRENFAARGTAHTAFHVYDPDGNMLELHTYAPLEWFPRRGRDPLGRFLWLRRVIDKARAHAAGTIGEYIYPCPIDQGVMERWGITRDEFERALKDYAHDEAMLQWAEARISGEASAAANSWLCVETFENLDRQDREEFAFI